jgi:hypothetical protein
MNAGAWSGNWSGSLPLNKSAQFVLIQLLQVWSSPSEIWFWRSNYALSGEGEVHSKKGGQHSNRIVAP